MPGRTATAPSPTSAPRAMALQRPGCTPWAPPAPSCPLTWRAQPPSPPPLCACGTHARWPVAVALALLSPPPPSPLPHLLTPQPSAAPLTWAATAFAQCLGCTSPLTPSALPTPMPTAPVAWPVPAWAWCCPGLLGMGAGHGAWEAGAGTGMLACGVEGGGAVVALPRPLRSCQRCWLLCQSTPSCGTSCAWPVRAQRRCTAAAQPAPAPAVGVAPPRQVRQEQVLHQ